MASPREVLHLSFQYHYNSSGNPESRPLLPVPPYPIYLAPLKVSPHEPKLLKTPENLVDPVVYEGVLCMSYGWSPRGKSAAMLRGPMVSGVVTQLARGTAWGELDVLVIDMPPGTVRFPL
jgi:hypothetical protein